LIGSASGDVQVSPDSLMRPCSGTNIFCGMREGEVMTWYPGWHLAAAWLLAIALAAVVYFMPITRFIEN
jgi:hypothetical protein